MNMSMELMLDYEKNKKEIELTVERCHLSTKGIGSILYLFLDKNTDRQKRELDLERKAILKGNKDNWVNRLFRRKPQHVLILHITAIPDDPKSEAYIPDCTNFVTGLEVFPPLPDEENKLVISGVYEALRSIEIASQGINANIMASDLPIVVLDAGT